MSNNIKKNLHGNTAITVICGIAGVFIGAFLVFIIMYANNSSLKIDREKTEAERTATAESETSVPTSGKDQNADKKSSDFNINYHNKSSVAMPQGSSAVADAVAKVAPAVVNIDTTMTTRVYNTHGFGFVDPFDYQIQEIPRGMGTGIIVSQDGIVLTNNHVVKGAKSIKVTLSDKSQHNASIIGTDPVSDLAILSIQTKERSFPTASLTNSNTMRIGDWVIALGNPLGVGQTATLGILSARNRTLSDSNVDLRNLLQTDAAINPGNSGGPLINLKGEVIGINTAIIRSAQGIGFAIPAETAYTVMKELRAHGRVSRPYLGIEMADLTQPARSYLGLDSNIKGVIVGRVLQGGPANKSGIKSNDVIVSINGTETSNAADLQAFVRSLKVGSIATVKLWRDGTEKEISVKLEELPSSIFQQSEE
ncbi:MAG: S1C family serine protease [Candidatus Bruticola sp.]